MFRNYLNIAVRNLLKHKGYSFITIAGLAVGIACCILIFLYVKYELGYDRYHANVDRIYRFELENWAATPLAVGPYMKQTYPEVENFVRFYRVNRALVGNEEQMFTEKRFFFADSTLFGVLSVHLLAGDSLKALAAPNSIVLTQEMAEKYFGRENPLGKTLKVRTGKPAEFTVTGIVENLPPQSHFRFDFVASLSTLPFKPDDNRVQWNQSLAYTYVLMKPHADLVPMGRSLEKVLHARTNTPDTSSLRVYMRPIADIHLYSECEKEIEPVSSIRYVYILSTVALFILFLAIINFINLSTARSMKRAREVAMRKTLGAHRAQIVVQFLGESSLISLLATLSAAGIVELVLPQFNALTGINVSLLGSGGTWSLVSIACASLFVGIAAGSYPAFFLSRFQPVKVMKSGGTGDSPSSASAMLRKGLVVLQFTVSIALIVGSMLITNQLDFIQNRKLGLDKEQVLIMPVSSITLDRYDAFKAELLKQHSVSAVSASFSVPGERVVIEEFAPKNTQEKTYGLRLLLTDYDFPETFGFDLAQGRSFSREHPSDTSGAFMINEKAAALFGWATPVGQHIDFPSQNRGGEVIGIVKDFNYASLHSEIEPLVIHLDPNPVYYKYLSVRLGAGDKRAALNTIEQTWKKILPGRPFEFYFLDESFKNLYISETRLRSIVVAFTVVGILIACLGLLGLVSLAVVQRTKEIGIRKVLGASVGGIIGLISKDFLKLVLLANLIAWPLAWWMMSAWLNSFAYKISIGIDVFLLAGILALVVAFATIIVQTIKAALTNPVDAVRYE